MHQLLVAVAIALAVATVPAHAGPSLSRLNLRLGDFPPHWRVDYTFVRTPSQLAHDPSGAEVIKGLVLLHEIGFVLGSGNSKMLVMSDLAQLATPQLAHAEYLQARPPAQADLGPTVLALDGTEGY